MDMPAYVISEVTVLDEERADAYRELAAASIAQYQGHYLSRGLRPDAVEGTWPQDARLMVVEFPNIAVARQWYASPEYARALEIRATALDRRLLFIEGTTAG
jgi:uncharacterized protein (DUF1330 family)